MLKTYIGTYLGICVIIYFIGIAIDFVVYLLRFHVVGQVWYALKTTNLTIMQWVERGHSFFKRTVYKIPTISVEIGFGYISIEEQIKDYGLKRDKVYYIILLLLRWVISVFGLNKRNVITILVVLVYMNYQLLMGFLHSAWDRLIQIDKSQVTIAVNMINSKLQGITLESIKSLLIIVLLVVVIVVIINLIFNAKVKYIREFELIWLKQSEEKVSEIAILQEKIFEDLINLRISLGTNIREVVMMIRKIDYNSSKGWSYYFEAKNETAVAEIKDCKDIFEGIKDKILKIEEIKGAEIYTQYNKQFKQEVWELGLNDSTKETWKTREVLENKKDILSVLLPNEFPYENDFTSTFLTRNKIDYNEEFVEITRLTLYRHLKDYMEYYNNLTNYLIKVSKRRKKIRRKIYTRKQLKLIKEQIEQAKSYLG